MSTLNSDQRFRQAAESEGGMTISAGARVAHIRLALESGRAVNVDVSDVPESDRAPLIEAIRELVRNASRRSIADKSSTPENLSQNQ